MKVNTNRKSVTVNIALTGLMAALVLVGTFLSIKLPVMSGKAQIGFGNVFCIFSGFLLGPVYGGAAAGIGSGIYDLIGGWADSAPFTLLFKFMMAFVCGVIAWGGDRTAKKVERLIVAAVTGSFSYSVLYLSKSYMEAVLLGNADETIAVTMLVKAGVTLLNAVIADVIAIPLFLAIRAELEKSGLYFGTLGKDKMIRIGLQGPAVPGALLAVIQGILCTASIAMLYAKEKEFMNVFFILAAVWGLAQAIGALTMFHGPSWGYPMTVIFTLGSAALSTVFTTAAASGYMGKYIAIGIVFAAMSLLSFAFLILSRVHNLPAPTGEDARR